MKRILLPLCIVLALLIVIISLTTVSFSWFEPGSNSGMGLQFSQDTSVRSQNCEITNFSGSKNKGIFTYYPLNDLSTVTVTAGTTAYYKTVIYNENEKYDTNISLYLKSFSVSSGGYASIGVATPTNTYRTFTAAKDNVHIIRNAYISAYSSSVAGSGSVSIEWFVKCDEGSVTFNPSQVYLTYN